MIKIDNPYSDRDIAIPVADHKCRGGQLIWHHDDILEPVVLKH